MNTHLIRSRPIESSHIRIFRSVDRPLECGNSDAVTVGNRFVVLRNSKGRKYVNV